MFDDVFSLLIIEINDIQMVNFRIQVEREKIKKEVDKILIKWYQIPPNLT